MGRKLVAIITDDHTGKEVDETEAKPVTLSARIEDQIIEWEWWLVPTSRENLMTTLTKFCAAGGGEPITRDATAEPAPAANRNSKRTTNPDNEAIRTWHRHMFASLNAPQWKAMGLPEPKDKGAIPQAVRDAYYRDNPEVQQPTLDAEG